MPYLWLRASNDFGASHYGIQAIKMDFNHFWMLVTFQYRELHHLDMYCTLSIEAWLKSNIHFDCRILELCNACIIGLVFIVLNDRGGTESKYPSIVFLSIFWINKFHSSKHCVKLLLRTLLHTQTVIVSYATMLKHRIWLESNLCNMLPTIYQMHEKGPLIHKNLNQ